MHIRPAMLQTKRLKLYTLLFIATVNATCLYIILCTFLFIYWCLLLWNMIGVFSSMETFGVSKCMPFRSMAWTRGDLLCDARRKNSPLRSSFQLKGSGFTTGWWYGFKPQSCNSHLMPHHILLGYDICRKLRGVKLTPHTPWEEYIQYVRIHINVFVSQVSFLTGLRQKKHAEFFF